jgi:hypothetical protein
VQIVPDESLLSNQSAQALLRDAKALTEKAISRKFATVRVPSSTVNNDRLGRTRGRPPHSGQENNGHARQAHGAR